MNRELFLKFNPYLHKIFDATIFNSTIYGVSIVRSLNDRRNETCIRKYYG